MAFSLTTTCFCTCACPHIQCLTLRHAVCVVCVGCVACCYNCLCVQLQTEFKQTPITAVTATATAAVQADIISTLGITRSVTVHQVGLVFF